MIKTPRRHLRGFTPDIPPASQPELPEETWIALWLTDKPVPIPDPINDHLGSAYLVALRMDCQITSLDLASRPQPRTVPWQALTFSAFVAQRFPEFREDFEVFSLFRHYGWGDELDRYFKPLVAFGLGGANETAIREALLCLALFWRRVRQEWDSGTKRHHQALIPYRLGVSPNSVT